jgi:hypothetical protein
MILIVCGFINEKSNLAKRVQIFYSLKKETAEETYFNQKIIWAK